MGIWIFVDREEDLIRKLKLETQIPEPALGKGP